MKLQSCVCLSFPLSTGAGRDSVVHVGGSSSQRPSGDWQRGRRSGRRPGGALLWSRQEGKTDRRDVQIISQTVENGAPLAGGTY